jgi:hypothetical protein
MPSQNANNEICHDPECEHNFPYMRAHIHVRTNDGEYVRFVIENGSGHY